MIHFRSGEPEPGVRTSGIRLLHALAGLDVPLVPASPRSSRTAVEGTLGVGITGFRAEGFGWRFRTGPEAGSLFSIRDRDPTLSGRLRARLRVGTRVAVLLESGAFVTFTDEETTALFEYVSGRVRRFGRAWSFVVAAGARVGP